MVKGRPPLREWELNNTSTRYDWIAAGPSDEVLTKYWTAWAVIASLVGFMALIVFMGLVSSRKARKNPFNLYLIYLMIPDFILSLLCAITCTLNTINGEFTSTWMCNFQVWYAVFGIGGNAWLNAIVTYQLHMMLRLSHQRRRYKSPTPQRVTLHAISVYLYISFIGLMGLIKREHFPFTTGSLKGLACIPIEANKESSIFFWACFFPAFVGIPLVYICYATYDIFRNGLLPPMGKRRTLVIFFCRLIGVFLVMWIPTFVVMFVCATWIPVSIGFAGGTWGHLQGAVSATVSLMKPDVFEAVKDFVLCRCYSQDKLEEGAAPTVFSHELSLSRRSSSQPNQQQQLPVFQTRLSGFSEDFSIRQSETSLATCCENDEQSPGAGLEPIVDNETEEAKDSDDDSFKENP